MDLLNIILLISGILFGGVLSYFIYNKISEKKKASIIDEAKMKAFSIVKEAESESEAIKKEKILQAKEKFIELKSKHEDNILKREKGISEIEKRLKRKEQSVNEKGKHLNREKREIENQKNTLEQGLKRLEIRKKEVEDLFKTYTKDLEQIAQISKDEAKQKLIQSLKDEAKTDAMAEIQNIKEEAELTAKNEAKKIIIQSIQRLGTETAIENSVTVFNIESDDMKGRIIGREGRNIRAFEAATGVELVVDDTPEAIVISCFDPVRREIARLALEKLMKDGRIHPAKIEDIVKKTEKEIDEQVIQAGKKTVIDLGIHGLHPELVKIVGRMKFRSSYGQNLLQHSREVAHLSGIMASELGLNPTHAKRAGLLHDIGKVPLEESETPHALLGMEWAKKHKEHPDVCNAIGAHHDEIEMTSLLSPVIQVCDAISGARPGARKQVLESYLKRLKDLESLAMSFDGVIKCYAIQAGRELRVIVESEKVDDKKASEISYNISQKIQKEMTYPGQVRVTVIREVRSISVAK